MTDELDKLRSSMKAALPTADPEAKATALRLALENFDRHQETANAARPMSDRPERAGFLTGVREMLSRLTSRGALAATASVAAIGVAIAIYPQLRPADMTPKPISFAQPGEAVPAVKENRTFDERAAPAPQADLGRSERREREADALAADTDALSDAPTMERPASPAPSSVADQSAGSVVGLVAEGVAKREAVFPDAMSVPSQNTEAYASADPNPVRIAADEPVSTFSIDTDTASWPVIRSSLMSGSVPPKEAVRVEEMVNYFPYAYPAPRAGEAPFRTSVSLFHTPWNKDTELLRIGLQGAMPATDDRPPLNLVFLIDTSGSMDDETKLPLLKQSFRLMLGQLRPEDRVAIVTYAGSAGLVLEPTAASDQSAILSALNRLDAGGATAGQDGLEQAYAEAEKMGGDGHVSRILLATDGDFNVGLSDPDQLKDYIAKKRESGIYLSVLGFGRGNLDDATMQALAQNGNGTAAYIDTLSEAQKVLVDQLSGALFPIADDVKIQVEFNPAVVAEYRLIGYETRALAREDFNNDKVDAGEIGAGHQVTALYEITPVGSPAQLSDPLRYGSAATSEPDGANELGFLKLRYKLPGASASQVIEAPIPVEPGQPDADARFAAAVAGMGQLLSEPKYLGHWGWDDAITLANGAKGDDLFGYRAEAIQMMRLAQSLSH